MKPICPTCQVVIPDAEVNLAQGICRCPSCGEYHKLGFLLRDSGVVERTAQPGGSAVGHYREADSMGFIIPRNGFRGPTWFFLFFAAFWNAITWVMLGAAFKEGQMETVLFMLIFVAVGLVMLGIFLFMAFGEITVAADTRAITVIWSLKNIRFRRTALLGQIDSIEESSVYTKNYQPVYGVGIKHGKKWIKFGSNLTEDERRWMIGELRDFRAAQGY